MAEHQHHAEHHHAEHGPDDSHRVNYLIVFFALCIFTALSILADVIHLPSKALLIVIVLAVATAKALSVMLFFMHLKFERNWKYVLLAPTTILAIGVPLALLPDIGVHYYTYDVPQNDDRYMLDGKPIDETLKDRANGITGHGGHGAGHGSGEHGTTESGHGGADHDAGAKEGSGGKEQ